VIKYKPQGDLLTASARGFARELADVKRKIKQRLCTGYIWGSREKSRMSVMQKETRSRDSACSQAKMTTLADTAN